MFQGTIPGPMRAIVREAAGRWPRGEVYVPCCGNFTIERSVAGMGFALHSSDVSIYTTAIGRWLTRQPVGIRLREESTDHLGWLADSLDDGVGTVATLMLGTRFLASVGREGLCHERVVRSYRERREAKHAETVQRLSGSDVELASYEVEGVRSWLQKVPRDAPVCSFPPFYGGGYEKLYEPLNEHFVWDAHEYEPLSDADVVDVLGAITDRPYWLTASNHDVPDLHPYLRGVIKATPRAAPFYVYASEAPTRIVTPRQPIEPVKAPRLGRGDEVVGPIKLAMLKPGQFNALRSRYLNPRIAPGAANLAVAVKDGAGAHPGRVRAGPQQLHAGRGVPAERLRCRADRLPAPVQAGGARRHELGGAAHVPAGVLALYPGGVHDGVQQQPGVHEVPRVAAADQARPLERGRLEVPAPVPGGDGWALARRGPGEVGEAVGRPDDADGGLIMEETTPLAPPQMVQGDPHSLTLLDLNARFLPHERGVDPGVRGIRGLPRSGSGTEFRSARNLPGLAPRWTNRARMLLL